MGDTMSGNPLTIRKWASVTVPTLVMVGGASHAFFHNGTQMLVDILPNAQYRRLKDQDHGRLTKSSLPRSSSSSKAETTVVDPES